MYFCVLAELVIIKNTFGAICEPFYSLNGWLYSSIHFHSLRGSLKSQTISTAKIHHSLLFEFNLPANLHYSNALASWSKDKCVFVCVLLALQLYVLLIVYVWLHSLYIVCLRERVVLVCLMIQTILYVYVHLYVAARYSPGAWEPICRGEGGQEGWMASHSRRVGVKLRAPNYSPGSHSLPASPSAPMFGCIFPGRVTWYAPLVSKALVSGGLHLSTKHGCVWLAGLNEIPS